MNLLFIFTAFQMQNPCQKSLTAKKHPKTAKKEKNVAFFSGIFSK